MPISHLVHTRTGTGEPVVLTRWCRCWRRSTGSSRSTSRDFGESPAYLGRVPYTMDNACRDLAQNFALWGVERPHVVGNSLGGAIALELGSRGLARSVVGLATAGFFGSSDRFTALSKLLALSDERLGPYLVLRGGIRLAEGEIAWCDEALSVLERR